MKTQKLVILSNDAEEYLEIIRCAALPELSIEILREVDGNNQDLKDCDILLGSPDLLSNGLVYAQGVKWVQSTWAGITPLLAADLRRDYILTGVKGVFGPLMAEYVLCYMLMHERKVLERYRNQLDKKWDMSQPSSLRGKCIGIMGLGSIGVQIAQMVMPFGMKILGYSRSRTSCEGFDRCFFPDELTHFVQELDYLVCVLPDTPATDSLVDGSVLMAMRETALIINVGRGNVIDEKSLVQALENNEIGGAVLDVFQNEPLPTSHPLWETPNTVITSHTAAMSVPELVAPVFIENYRRYVEKKPLNYVIDFNQGY
ncbi:MAG: D-2-hydroxyacid dehydrogenase [Desulforhopalus sp.]